MRHYGTRWFPPAGFLVEVGCGSGEASARLPRPGRTLIGLDFSLAALLLARRGGVYRALVAADAARLPFRDGALAGVWNLGVLEHFEPALGRRVLAEIARVLRPGDGTAILFWPPTYGLSRWVLAPIEWLRSRRDGRPFRFYPDEVARLPSRDAGRRALAEVGLAPLAAEFGPRDGFNHVALVGRRPA